MITSLHFLKFQYYSRNVYSAGKDQLVNDHIKLIKDLEKQFTFSTFHLMLSNQTRAEICFVYYS